MITLINNNNNNNHNTKNSYNISNKYVIKDNEIQIKEIKM